MFSCNSHWFVEASVSVRSHSARSIAREILNCNAFCSTTTVRTTIEPTIWWTHAFWYSRCKLRELFQTYENCFNWLHTSAHDQTQQLAARGSLDSTAFEARQADQSLISLLGQGGEAEMGIPIGRQCTLYCQRFVGSEFSNIVLINAFPCLSMFGPLSDSHNAAWWDGATMGAEFMSSTRLPSRRACHYLEVFASGGPHGLQLESIADHGLYPNGWFVTYTGSVLGTTESASKKTKPVTRAARRVIAELSRHRKNARMAKEEKRPCLKFLFFCISGEYLSCSA